MNWRFTSGFQYNWKRYSIFPQQRRIPDQHGLSGDRGLHASSTQLFVGVWLRDGNILPGGIIHYGLGQRMCRAPVGGGGQTHLFYFRKRRIARLDPRDFRFVGRQGASFIEDHHVHLGQ